MKKEIKYTRAIFTWYELIVSSLVIIISIYSFFFNNFLPLNFLIAILGLFGGYYLIKKKIIGFYISLLWATLQTLIIQIGELTINLTQFLFFTLTFIRFFELENLPEIILIPNIVGIILVILLIIWRKDFR